jgi:hypothetical protein
MIDAIRINISDNIVFDNIKLYSLEEQKAANIPNLFEGGQIYFRDKFNKRYACDDDMVGDITLREQSPLREFVKVSRITITWNQIVYSPAWIIPDSLCEKHGIPVIFIDQKQFCFIADRHLHVTKDEHIALIEF